MNKKAKINPAARHKARRFALQALYQWQLSHQTINEIMEQYAQEPLMPKADFSYFQELIGEIPAKAAELDSHFQAYLEDRSINELDPIELAILRMATFEFADHLEIPYRVVINEAVELAKEFGAEDGYKYINGVLDQVAKQLRNIETKS